MGEKAEKVVARVTKKVEYRETASWSQKLVRFFDYIFILRPTLFFPVWTVFAAGYFSAMRQAKLSSTGFIATNQEQALLIGFALTLLMGSVFILNQIIDIPVDRENNKLFLIANGHVSRQIAYLEAIAFGLLAIGLAFRHSGQVGANFLLIFIVTGVLYSLPPFLWKDRAFAGLVANILGAVLIFSTGWWTLQYSLAVPIYRAIPYAFAVGAVYLFTTIPDKAGDEQFHKRTFAVKFGEHTAILAGTLLEIIALVTAWAFQDPIIFYPAMFAAPFFIYAAWRQQKRDVVLAIKIPILLLALSVCVFWPFYFIILFLTFYISKWYYAKRFGLHYPSLESD